MSEAGWAVLFGVVVFGGLFAAIIVIEIQRGETERARLRATQCDCGDDDETHHAGL